MHAPAHGLRPGVRRTPPAVPGFPISRTRVRSVRRTASHQIHQPHTLPNLLLHRILPRHPDGSSLARFRAPTFPGTRLGSGECVVRNGLPALGMCSTCESRIRVGWMIRPSVARAAASPKAADIRHKRRKPPHRGSACAGQSRHRAPVRQAEWGSMLRAAATGLRHVSCSSLIGNACPAAHHHAASARSRGESRLDCWRSVECLTQ